MWWRGLILENCWRAFLSRPNPPQQSASQRARHGRKEFVLPLLKSASPPQSFPVSAPSFSLCLSLWCYGENAFAVTMPLLSSAAAPSSSTAAASAMAAAAGSSRCRSRILARRTRRKIIENSFAIKFFRLSEFPQSESKIPVEGRRIFFLFPE